MKRKPSSFMKSIVHIICWSFLVNLERRSQYIHGTAFWKTVQGVSIIYAFSDCRHQSCTWAPNWIHIPWPEGACCMQVLWLTFRPGSSSLGYWLYPCLQQSSFKLCSMNRCYICTFSCLFPSPYVYYWQNKDLNNFTLCGSSLFHF